MTIDDLICTIQYKIKDIEDNGDKICILSKTFNEGQIRAYNECIVILEKYKEEVVKTNNIEQHYRDRWHKTFELIQRENELTKKAYEKD